MAHRFVGPGAPGENIYLYRADRKTKVRQVMWGDFLTIDGAEADGWLRVVWAPRSADPQTLFIPQAHTSEMRPLEIIFVDVGQGDGAVLITPETGAKERIIVIDAGVGDNMARFLNGRFKAYAGFSFDAAVITHPDKDHYYGFKEIFRNTKIGFRTIYHSGLIERPVPGKFEKLGVSRKDPRNGVVYFHELADGREDFEAHFADAEANGRYDYPEVMHAALSNPKVKAFAMLSTAHGAIENGRSFMPGFAPSDGRGYVIETLGPVVEPAANGAPRLRKIGDYGETKNGHSILLRLAFGKFSVLFGGDLNEKAEKRLLAHYGGVDHFPEPGSPAYRTMIAKAAERLRADVMKTCHHGSEKVTDAFLEAVNPAAFVISSGDEEGHVHPRPDLLGRLGRFGRGGAPVLLSTELQRSTREREDRALLDRIERSLTEAETAAAPDVFAKLRADIKELAKTNVDVYGAIYLKTDGEQLVVAFKIETGSLVKRWFSFRYAVLANGELARID